MGIVAAQLGITGLIPNTTGLGKNLAQQIPTFILLESDNTLAEVLVTGYLNASARVFGIPYSNQQVALVYTTDAGSVWLQIAVTGTPPNYVYSLVGSTDVANVFVAAVGSAAAPSYTFSGHTGTGMYYAATNSVAFSAGGLLSFVVSSAASAVNHLVAGSTATNAGNAALQPGFTAVGTDTNIDVSASGKGTGGFAVLPSSTAAAANLKLWNGAGNFFGSMAFAALGQNTAYTMADVGAATGGILVTTTPLRSKYVVGAAAAGGAAAQSFTDAYCSSASHVVGNWVTQANAASVLKIVPGNGSFVVTSSADAGVGTFTYTITKA